MNSVDLIAKVGAGLIASESSGINPENGTARFILDNLPSNIIVALCLEILSHPSLSRDCRIRIPRDLATGYSLPEEILTDEKATYWRNASCDRKVLIIANVDDEQRQSLRDIPSIGSEDILSRIDLWTKNSMTGTALSPDQSKVWVNALTGLLKASPLALEMFSEYILLTSKGIEEQSLPIIHALGWALPALQIPRDSGYFTVISEKKRAGQAQWKSLYSELFRRRQPFLMKTMPDNTPMDIKKLKDQLKDIENGLKDSTIEIIKEFIEAPSRWSAEAEALSKLEWIGDGVSQLFEGAKKKEEKKLGKDTLDFFSGYLTDEEESLLKLLDQKKSKYATEDEIEFFEDYRIKLSKLVSLKGRWEKYIFGAPIECVDFYLGLLEAIGTLLEREKKTKAKKKVIVRTDKKADKDWFKTHSWWALRYFCYRYRGLKELLNNKAGLDIEWDVNGLFEIDELFDEAVKTTKGDNQIKFDVVLVKDTATEPQSLQILWKFNPNSVSTGFFYDLDRMKDNPFIECSVVRESVGLKGNIQPVELTDVNSFMAISDQFLGSLVPEYEESKDGEKKWLKELEDCHCEGSIQEKGYVALLNAWKGFAKAYGVAINSYLIDGLASETSITLIKKYELLLETLFEYAPGDKNKRRLWLPVLRIGNVRVEGQEALEIVPPWHPLRLCGIIIKAGQIARLLQHILKEEPIEFGDSRLFFEDIIDEFAEPYYPEIVISIKDGDAVTLVKGDSYCDYTLMEGFTFGSGEVDSSYESPAKAVNTIKALAKQYLELLPHEKTNLSLMLFNCDSAGLPITLIDSLANLYEEEEEARCQILLRHKTRNKLNRAFQAIIDGNESVQEALKTSDIYNDFMARLRIGVITDEQKDKFDLRYGPPIDLVYLQDVIYSMATQRWEKVDGDTAVVNILEHCPARGTRRKPLTTDDLKSYTYLACPVQPRIGWLYMNAIKSVEGGSIDDYESCYVPALEVNFQDKETQDVFKEVHDLGHWIINYDMLLSRQLLSNQGIQVILFRKNRLNERNLIVSSKEPHEILDVLVKRKLRDLLAGTSISGEAIAEHELKELAARCIENACDISGAIILRAAKRGIYVNELIGLVMSRAIIESELGDEVGPIGWYFLDDYATWLGQKEGRIADIMAIAPRIDDNNNHVLNIFISEAKCISVASMPNDSKKSKNQLTDTVARIADALFGNPGRLDRDIWLNKISDMLVDGMVLSPTDRINISEWQKYIREGSVKIVLKGYSHVFVHSKQPGDADPSGQRDLNEVQENCWQEIFGPELLKEVLVAYMNNDKERITEIRRKLGPEEPWEGSVPKAPTEKVSLSTLIGSGDITPEEEQPLEVATDDHTVRQQEGDEVPEPDKAITKKEQIEGEQEGGAFIWAPGQLRSILSSMEKEIKPLDEDEVWLNDSVSRLRNALIGYGMQAKLISRRLTPNAALATFQGSDLLTESQVHAHRSKLKTVHSLDICNIIPELGYVTISIARPKRQTINLIQQWKDRDLTYGPGMANLKLLVGAKESSGEALYLEPSVKDAPHTLIAGTTGSGKSVLIQNLIIDIACTNTPNQAEILVIDPKQGIDYTELAGLPHLVKDIITDQEEASKLLTSVVEEMNARMKAIAGHAPNILEYNKQVSEDKRFPIIWLFHDEFAAWMIDDNYSQLVSNIVQQIGMMARAAGIFLMFAAQRPEARVMTAQLRSNLDNRLILRVASEADSEMALGQKGAEQLLGKGHLAARLPEENNIILAQVPMLPNKEKQEIVQVIKEMYS